MNTCGFMASHTAETLGKWGGGHGVWQSGRHVAFVALSMGLWANWEAEETSADTGGWPAPLPALNCHL